MLGLPGPLCLLRVLVPVASFPRLSTLRLSMMILAAAELAAAAAALTDFPAQGLISRRGANFI